MLARGPLRRRRVRQSGMPATLPWSLILANFSSIAAALAGASLRIGDSMYDRQRLEKRRETVKT